MDPMPFGYQYQPQQQQSVINGVPYVASIDEVKAASVPFGISLFMSSTTDNVFYAKNHRGLIKAFRFEEMPIPSNDPQNFVTRQEFDDLRRQYEQLVRQHGGAAATPAAQPYAADADGPRFQGDPGAGQAATVRADSFNGMDQGAAGSVPQPSGYDV